MEENEEVVGVDAWFLQRGDTHVSVPQRLFVQDESCQAFVLFIADEVGSGRLMTIAESISINEINVLSSWTDARAGALVQIRLKNEIVVGMRCTLPGPYPGTKAAPGILLFDGTVEQPEGNRPALVLPSTHLEVGVRDAPVRTSEFEIGSVYALTGDGLFVFAQVSAGVRTFICVRGGHKFALGSSNFGSGPLPDLIKVGEVKLTAFRLPEKIAELYDR